MRLDLQLSVAKAVSWGHPSHSKKREMKYLIKSRDRREREKKCSHFNKKILNRECQIRRQHAYIDQNLINYVSKVKVSHSVIVFNLFMTPMD